MGVNQVSNHNHAHHTRAVRTQETNSQQAQAPRISDVKKEGGDRFERSLTFANGSGPSAEEMKAFNEGLAKFRAENAREPDAPKGPGIIQYERPAPESEQQRALRERDAKIPETNSDRLYVEIRLLSQEPDSEEKTAKWTELIRLRTVEMLKERGIKVNTGDTDEERSNYENRLNAALTERSKEPVAADPKAVATQKFAVDAMDFLADAATRIINGDEGASLSSLGINRNDLAKMLVETFSSYEHANTDVTSLMKQSEDLIREFAKQISDGQEPDFNSLATELTINGENRTIGQLMGK